MSVEEDPQFVRWLDQELGSAVRSVRGPSPRAEQAAYRARGRRTLVPAPGRLVAGVAIAILAIIAGGVLAVAAYAGSPNPAEWGPAVVRVVSGCWDITADGRRVRDTDCERSSAAPATAAASPAVTSRATPAGPVSLHETRGESGDTGSAAASGDPVPAASPNEGDQRPPKHGDGHPPPGEQGQQNDQGQGSQDKQSKDEHSRP